jgi:hypothetical protein
MKLNAIATYNLILQTLRHYSSPTSEVNKAPWRLPICRSGPKLSSKAITDVPGDTVPIDWMTLNDHISQDISMEKANNRHSKIYIFLW